MIRKILILLLFILSLSCAKVEGRGNGYKQELSPVPNPLLHFPFDSDEILVSEVSLLDENADWLKRNGNAVVILEGHCDEVGETDYNMELGDRRARSIKAHLIQRGVNHDRVIMVVSFGESRPINSSRSREAWRQNRRVEFILR